MKVIVRKMKKRDIPAVQDVARISWNATYEGVIPSTIQEDFLKDAYSVRNLNRRRRRTNIFVAVVNGEIIGFANYSKVHDDKSAHLYAIYLYPDYQGRGIGSALLQQGIDELDVEMLTLNVEIKNSNALQFYKRKGFKEVKQYEEELLGHTLHIIRMALEVERQSIQ